MYAIANNDEEGVRILINGDCDFLTLRAGLSPLMFSAMEGHVQICELLCKNPWLKQNRAIDAEATVRHSVHIFATHQLSVFRHSCFVVVALRLPLCALSSLMLLLIAFSGERRQICFCDQPCFSSSFLFVVCLCVCACSSSCAVALSRLVFLTETRCRRLNGLGPG
jgi:hypothetical protein